MPFHATILYPNEANTVFDMDYYLNKHMPLVMERFGKFGVKAYQVTEYYKPGGAGAGEGEGAEEKPPFCTGCTLVWDSPDQLGAAMSSDDAKPVLADIQNFCNKSPVFMGGAVVAATS